jgi:hypothetical protein
VFSQSSRFGDPDRTPKGVRQHKERRKWLFHKKPKKRLISVPVVAANAP